MPLSFALLCVLLVACQDRPPSEPAPVPVGEPAPYRFDAPDAAFQLPSELAEVSALGVLEDGRLVAVQDEDGVLYVIDPASGQVVSRVGFGGSGDYEGVERVGRQVFVLQSNGRLSALTDDGEGGFDRATERLDLPGQCDAEGLGHDPTSGFLLVACKERPGSGLDDARALYAFSLGGALQNGGPAFVIDLNEIARREAAAQRRRGVLDALSGPPGEPARFKPSGVAVHPHTGQVWVLSSRAPAIAVLGRDGALEAYYPLDVRRYPQAEGIAFLDDGTLFLTNEAGSGPSTLLRFALQPAPPDPAAPGEAP